MPSNVYPTQESLVTAPAQLIRYGAFDCSATGGETVLNSFNAEKDYRYSTAAGWTTPGWREMKNSGALLPMTEWNRFTVESHSGLGHRGWCYSGMKNVYTNFYTATPSIVTMKQAYFVDKVGEVDLQYYVQKAASTIYTSGWDAATFIAEITQLRRMLSGVGKKLANLSQGRKPGELFDLWLEGRYGWRTLMYDIRDLQQALSAANDRRTRYRQTCGFTTTGNWNESYMSGSDIVDEISNDISWTINMRGTVVADIDVPTFQFNPVTTAWEVTKLSFVIDWLLNVGQALEAASFLLAVKDYKACGGYKIDFNLTGSRVHVSHESYLSNVTSDGTWNATATAICRVPMTVSASPHMKLRLDGYKVIDLLALIAQRLR